jgi:poly-gamma-glutamate capsule biosynthesis protein CapA/YwtB (metallophosphatase superfamily)
VINADNTLKILFAGDFCPSGEIEKAFFSQNRINIYSDFLNILQNADFRVVNLECPLTESQNPITKTGPNIKASPAIVELIRDGHFDLVTLANNHILDYGDEGLNETIGACNKAGIHTVGAGRDLSEASKPFKIEINGITLSFINVCEKEYSIAGNNSAGANPFDFYFTSQLIKKAKEVSDVVFVVYHGGNEHYHLPSPRLQKTFRFLADSGADAVIGHHTHCYSGIEMYSGKPMVFSLGNFLFSEKTHFEPWYYGYTITFEITKNQIIRYVITPYEQCKQDIVIKKITPEQETIFNSNLEALNKIITNEIALKKEWDTFTENKKYYYLDILNPPSPLRKGIVTLLRKVLGIRLTRRPTLRQFNCTRNEAHLEVLQGVLHNFYIKKRC